ncbi:MAG TPA: hypothetical protein VGB42_10570 [Candidatus Thermoplasmatota archaeon]
MRTTDTRMGYLGTPERGPLSDEYDYFLSVKEDLMRNHEGRVGLIKGREFIAAFETWEEAYDAGRDRFGNVPILIVRICQGEEQDWDPVLEFEPADAPSQP